MGQQQSSEKKSLSELIKDVASFNLLAKTTTLKNCLGKSILAEVTKRHHNLLDSLPFVKKQDDLCIGIFVDKQYVQMAQHQFYYCKQLLQDLASIIMSDPTKEEGTCQICFEHKIDKLLPCGHSYCEDCIEGWFIVKEQNSCPMCRAQLTKQRMKNESYYVPNEAELIDSLKEQIFIHLQQQ